MGVRGACRPRATSAALDPQRNRQQGSGDCAARLSKSAGSARADEPPYRWQSSHEGRQLQRKALWHYDAAASWAAGGLMQLRESDLVEQPSRQPRGACMGTH